MPINIILIKKSKTLAAILDEYRASQECDTTYVQPLIEHFKALSFIQQQHETKITDEDKLAIEKQKLAIMQAITIKLKLSHETEGTHSKQRPSHSFLQQCFAYLYATVGPILAGIAGYLAATAIFNFISLTNPVSMGFAIVAGMLECALFIIRDLRCLKKHTGVSFFKTAELMSIYKKQLSCITKIHDSLLSYFCTESLSTNDYVAYKRLVKLFHQDLAEKNKAIKTLYSETPLRKITKVIFNSVDALLCASAGFFFGKCVLCLVTVSLASNPIGLAICGAIAVFSLATFIYLKRNTISTAIDKMIGEPKKLLIKQDNMLQHPNGISSFYNKIRLIIRKKKNQKLEPKERDAKFYLLEQKALVLTELLEKKLIALNSSSYIDKYSLVKKFIHPIQHQLTNINLASSSEKNNINDIQIAPSFSVKHVISTEGSSSANKMGGNLTGYQKYTKLSSGRNILFNSTSKIHHRLFCHSTIPIRKNIKKARAGIVC
jgi:hypothetical protein